MNICSNYICSCFIHGFEFDLCSCVAIFNILFFQSNTCLCTTCLLGSINILYRGICITYLLCTGGCYSFTHFFCCVS
jgi:hypothetical protein